MNAKNPTLFPPDSPSLLLPDGATSQTATMKTQHHHPLLCHQQEAFLPSIATMPSSPLPCVVLLLLFITTLLPATTSNLTTERTALIALRTSLHAQLGWDDATHICLWRGVYCDETNGTVIALRLPGASLLGSIPNGTLGSLPSLQVVSLRYNAIDGPLPLDLSKCTRLRVLTLRSNYLNGTLLPILALTALRSLDLSRNSFSDSIPPGLSSLARLSSLYLEHNNLTGKLPDLDPPLLQNFNVSFNKLTGPIPRSLHKFNAGSFLGMPDLCGGPLDPCPDGGDDGDSDGDEDGDGDGGGGGDGNLTGGKLAGIVVACVVAFLLLCLLGFLLFRRRRRGGRADSAVGNEDGQRCNPGPADPQPKPDAAATTSPMAESEERKELVFFGAVEEGKAPFDLEELLRASAEVLGKGMFGTTYKATLDDGTVVAVKRLKEVELPDAEFVEKVTAVGCMEHPNVVPLRAYHYGKEEKLLVYQYMPMGSLSAFLHGRKGRRQPISFETRLDIAVAVARGIEYIHSTGPAVSHGNIRSSNVLLDESSQSRVSDQTLAQLASINGRVANGYRAPEVVDPRNVTQAADVYSFGVLLLELLTGKAPLQSLANEDVADLPQWVLSCVKGEWSSKVFDPEMTTKATTEPPVEERMVEALQIGVDCAATFPDSRPTMAKVVVQLEEIRSACVGQSNGEVWGTATSP